MRMLMTVAAILAASLIVGDVDAGCGGGGGGIFGRLRDRRAERRDNRGGAMMVVEQRSVAVQVYSVTPATCPTCGQALPPGKVLPVPPGKVYPK